jgi:predicted dinucleotide-binding enzyme
MEIAIIGAGNVGAALAEAWARAGHSILLGLREAARHSELIGRTGARALTPIEAAQGAAVVVLALPYAAVESVVSDLGPLSGKILIDATNPVVRTEHGPDLALGFTDSAAEALARQVPQARVVKTLNQVGAEVMLDTSGFAHPPVMFMAGDDEDAKQVVSTLLAELGFEPLDAGALRRARLLEPLAMVWINQALMRGHGRDWAFAALPRKG